MSSIQGDVIPACFGTMQPNLSYPVPFWGSESQVMLFLFCLQKKAIRVILSLPRNQTFNMNNNTVSFIQAYIFETLMFVENNIFMLRVSSSLKYLDLVKNNELYCSTFLVVRVTRLLPRNCSPTTVHIKYSALTEYLRSKTK